MDMIGLLVFLGIVLVPVPASADVIALTPYAAARVDLTLLTMLANYALNLLVLGVPGIRRGTVTVGKVIRGTVWLTLLGQVADWLGALFALIAMDRIGFSQWRVVQRGDESTPMFREMFARPLPSEWWRLIGFNFLFTGITVGALALLFLRRWGVPKDTAGVMAGLAALLTNPTWTVCFGPVLSAGSHFP